MSVLQETLRCKQTLRSTSTPLLSSTVSCRCRYRCRVGVGVTKRFLYVANGKYSSHISLRQNAGACVMLTANVDSSNTLTQGH